METAEPLWRPSPERIARAHSTAFLRWLEQHRGRAFDDYESFWNWSVSDLEGFWGALWDFLDIRASRRYERVLGSRTMPGAEWFVGARLNLVDQVFRHVTDQRPAIIAGDETGAVREVPWSELHEQVVAVAATLRELGVQPGDRVVAILPNVPQTIIAFLACASVGAVWSVCSPDMGPVAVLDRFRQIAPKVLIACDGYRYGGKAYERDVLIAEIRGALPSVQHTIIVPLLHGALDARRFPSARCWTTLVSGAATLHTEQVPSDHPLWVVYSSGTTGLPKAIVHGHAGVLLEMLKGVHLHRDVGPEDRFFWYTTTGWIMWNVQVSGLLAGATAVLYDGHPGTPDLGTLWRFVERVRATFFGAGAAFFASCIKAGIEPARMADLASLRTLGSTGSPLPAEAYLWTYEQVKRDIWLVSIAGGTDLAGAFLTGLPTLPVYAGEMQCRALGLKVEAWDDAGRPLIDEVGELVCTAPLFLERRRRSALPRKLLRHVSGCLAPRRLDAPRATPGSHRRHHLRPFGCDDQPARHPHGHRGTVSRRRGTPRNCRLAGRRSRIPRARLDDAAVRRAPAGGDARRDAEAAHCRVHPRCAVGAPCAERDRRGA
jgi:acetoacetyl-CoA synthetase